VIVRVTLAFALSANVLFITPVRADGLSWAAISVVVQGVKFLFEQSTPKEINVTATGYGSSEKDAVHNALVSAVAQASGVLVVSDITTETENVTKSIGLQYSSGSVKNYSVLGCSINERVECRIQAVVSTQALQSNIVKASSSDPVTHDLRTAYAQLRVARESLIQRYRLTEYYLERLRKYGIKTEVKSIKVVSSISGNETLEVVYQLSLEPALKKEILRFLEHLERDTNGRDTEGARKGGIDPLPVFIQWGPTGLRENRVFVNTYDQEYYRRFQELLTADIEIYVQELDLCERLPVKGSFMTLDWYGYERTLMVSRPVNGFEETERLTFVSGPCPKVRQPISVLIDDELLHREKEPSKPPSEQEIGQAPGSPYYLLVLLVLAVLLYWFRVGIANFCIAVAKLAVFLAVTFLIYRLVT